jgi:adenylate cyclase class IV
MSEPTREVELKARVDDLDGCRRNVELAGGTLVFEGHLADRLYDTPDRALSRSDLVLRLRTYTNDAGVVAHLDWKGPTTHEDGFKVRPELTTGVSDGVALASMLERIGYGVVREIDRYIVQYEIVGTGAEGATIIRFERYPRMDVLVEVEGSQAGIEAAIQQLGIPRDEYSAGRLTEFAQKYEARTGLRPALSTSEL